MKAERSPGRPWRGMRTALVVAVMVLAAAVAPLALPVTLVVRWVRRDIRTVQVVPAPKVRLLTRSP